jgi:hypothetical protein
VSAGDGIAGHEIRHHAIGKRRPGIRVFGRLGVERPWRQAEDLGQAGDADLEGQVRQGPGLCLEPMGERPVERLTIAERSVDADRGAENGLEPFLAGLDAPARLALRLSGEPTA